MKKRLSVAGFVALAWILVSRPGDAAAEMDRPSLVVVICVDQLAYEYLDRFDRGFDPDGLVRRCDSRGTTFANCYHQHAFTSTGPGHSALLTGAYPDTTGVIDNEWYDRESGKQTYCVDDPDAVLIGGSGGDALVSPRRLLADTLGDQMKLASGRRSKVVGVAIKDRAAILMAGRLADGAYWLSEDGKWITCDHYQKTLPGYLRQLNEQGALRQYGGKVWDRFYQPGRYQHPATEDSTGESPRYGMGKDFPHVMPLADDPNYVRQIACSPFGNDFTLEAARAIVIGEQLGNDEYPDLLAINLSSNDYVGHSFGPYSLEVEDMTYRTDLSLSRFADFLDQQLGGRPWLLLVTSDHGVAPIPEQVARWGVPAKRNPLGEADKENGNIEAVRAPLERHLRSALGVADGEARLVDAVVANQVYFNERHPRMTGGGSDVQRLTRNWLLKQDAIVAAFTRDQLLDGADGDGLFAEVRLSFHPKRSGDVLYVLAPYCIQGSAPADHGSPWPYDRHVPLLVLGSETPRVFVPSGRVERQVSPAGIAATVARLLHVPPPSACVEGPLDEILHTESADSLSALR